METMRAKMRRNMRITIRPCRMEVYLPSHLKPLVRELADEFGPETRSHSGQPRCRPDRHGDRILGPDTTEASKEQTMYDINDDESVYAFGVTQGEALFADARRKAIPIGLCARAKAMPIFRLVNLVSSQEIQVLLSMSVHHQTLRLTTSS